MSGKQIEGGDRQRRKQTREAREATKKPSGVGASHGASRQRTRAARKLTHQQRVDLRREGKHNRSARVTPTARPGGGDRDTPDQEQYPRR